MTTEILLEEPTRITDPYGRLLPCVAPRASHVVGQPSLHGFRNTSRSVLMYWEPTLDKPQKRTQEIVCCQACYEAGIRPVKLHRDGWVLEWKVPWQEESLFTESTLTMLSHGPTMPGFASRVMSI